MDKGIANNASRKARPLSINEFNTNMDIYWKYKNDKFTINDDFKSRKFDTNEYIKRIQENEDKHQPIYLTQYTKQRYDEFMDRAAANSFNSKMYTDRADSLINRNAVGDDAVDLVSKGKEFISKLFKRK